MLCSPIHMSSSLVFPQLSYFRYFKMLSQSIYKFWPLSMINLKTLGKFDFVSFGKVAYFWKAINWSIVVHKHTLTALFKLLKCIYI